MRALFLNPPDLKGDLYMKEVGRCGRRSVAGELWPQTGLACLAAMAESAGAEARLIDAMAEAMDVDRLVDEAEQWRPDLLVVNTTTPTFDNDIEIVGRLRERCGALIALSGTHVSALPEESLAAGRADVILINEAEHTVAELIYVLKTHGVDTVRGDGGSVLSEVTGLAFRDASGAATRTEPRALEPDLDRLPLPARRLLPNDAYHMPFFSDGPFATVIPTRGCPWPCTFCRAGAVWGRRVRTRSPENVMQELRELAERFGICNVVFMTDSLTLNRDWLFELTGAMVSANLGIHWICNSRVDAVDRELLRAMKRAGCRMVSYGVESGDPDILKATRKGRDARSIARGDPPNARGGPALHGLLHSRSAGGDVGQRAPLDRFRQGESVPTM